MLFMLVCSCYLCWFVHAIYVDLFMLFMLICSCYLCWFVHAIDVGLFMLFMLVCSCYLCWFVHAIYVGLFYSARFNSAITTPGALDIWDDQVTTVNLFSYQLWRSKAIIILQLRYNDILTVMSILKIVSSYLLFVMSIFFNYVITIFLPLCQY
jgi:hypothetical protein